MMMCHFGIQGIQKRFTCHKTQHNHDILVHYKDQYVWTWKAVPSGMPQGSFSDSVPFNLFSFQIINIKANREDSSKLNGKKEERF